MNTLFYIISSKYFTLVWIGFLGSYIEVDGEDVWCPDWQVLRQRERERERERQTDRQIDRQADRETEKERERKRDRQRDRETEREK